MEGVKGRQRRAARGQRHGQLQTASTTHLCPMSIPATGMALIWATTARRLRGRGKIPLERPLQSTKRPRQEVGCHAWLLRCNNCLPLRASCEDYSHARTTHMPDIAVASGKATGAKAGSREATRSRESAMTSAGASIVSGDTQQSRKPRTPGIAKRGDRVSSDDLAASGPAGFAERSYSEEEVAEFGLARRESKSLEHRTGGRGNPDSTAFTSTDESKLALRAAATRWFPPVDAETGEPLKLNAAVPESPRSRWKREKREWEEAQRHKYDLPDIPKPKGTRDAVVSAADVQNARRQADEALRQLCEFEQLREEKRIEDIRREMDPLKRRWLNREIQQERLYAKRHIIAVAHDMEFVIAQKLSAFGFLR